MVARRPTLALAASTGPGRQSLWLVPVAGGRGTRLVEYEATTIGGLSWTPDGRTLVYSAIAGAQLQLFAIDTLGGEPQQLTHGESTLFRPKVSPDGRWIAATSMHHVRRVLGRPVS